MLYTHSDDSITMADLWEELSFNKKLGPRIAIKRKAAKYLAKKVNLR
jgi:hypothetical protein